MEFKYSIWLAAVCGALYKLYWFKPRHTNSYAVSAEYIVIGFISLICVFVFLAPIMHWFAIPALYGPPIAFLIALGSESIVSKILKWVEQASLKEIVIRLLGLKK